MVATASSGLSIPGSSTTMRREPATWTRGSTTPNALTRFSMMSRAVCICSEVISVSAGRSASSRTCRPPCRSRPRTSSMARSMLPTWMPGIVRPDHPAGEGGQHQDRDQPAPVVPSHAVSASASSRRPAVTGRRAPEGWPSGGDYTPVRCAGLKAEPSSTACRTSSGVSRSVSTCRSACWKACVPACAAAPRIPPQVPGELPAPGARLIRGLQEHQQVRLGEPLPHGGHVGVLLCDGAGSARRATPAWRQAWTSPSRTGRQCRSAGWVRDLEAFGQGPSRGLQGHSDAQAARIIPFAL